MDYVTLEFHGNGGLDGLQLMGKNVPDIVGEFGDACKMACENWKKYSFKTVEHGYFAGKKAEFVDYLKNN